MERDFIPVSKLLDTDPKVKALQMKYGKAAGLGHWVIELLELYRNSGRPLDMGKPIIKAAHADAHGMESSELDELLQDFSDLGLISPLLYENSKQVHNTHVQEHADGLAEISKRRAEAGRKSGESRRAKA